MQFPRDAPRGSPGYPSVYPAGHSDAARYFLVASSIPRGIYPGIPRCTPSYSGEPRDASRGNPGYPGVPAGYPDVPPGTPVFRSHAWGARGAPVGRVGGLADPRHDVCSHCSKVSQFIFQIRGRGAPCRGLVDPNLGAHVIPYCNCASRTLEFKVPRPHRVRDFPSMHPYDLSDAPVRPCPTSHHPTPPTPAPYPIPQEVGCKCKAGGGVQVQGSAVARGVGRRGATKGVATARPRGLDR
jgi:hypothetical protein